jgi:hypothetical protein
MLTAPKSHKIFHFKIFFSLNSKAYTQGPCQKVDHCNKKQDTHAITDKWFSQIEGYYSGYYWNRTKWSRSTKYTWSIIKYNFFRVSLLVFYVQSCLKVSWAGKFLYMILFQVEGRYTKNKKYSPFFIPFLPKRKKRKESFYVFFSLFQIGHCNRLIDNKNST